VDECTCKALERLASSTYESLGIDPQTPASAIRLIRAYFGREAAVAQVSPSSLAGRPTAMRLDGCEATFLVDPAASPLQMQQGLSRDFATYLLLFGASGDIACSTDAVETLARQLTVLSPCVLDDCSAFGNDIASLSGWWLLDSADTALRIHEVLRASMPSGVVRAAPLARELSRTA